MLQLIAQDKKRERFTKSIISSQKSQGGCVVKKNMHSKVHMKKKVFSKFVKKIKQQENKVHTQQYLQQYILINSVISLLLTLIVSVISWSSVKQNQQVQGIIKVISVNFPGSVPNFRVEHLTNP